MKISLVIPAKGHSERIHNKNLYKINGKSLVRRACEKALKCKTINHVYLDTEDEAIIKECIDLESSGLGIIRRPKELATNFIGANELMVFALHSIPKTDLLLQTFATSPMLKAETIDEIIKDFVKIRGYDSFLTVEPLIEYTWDIERNLPGYDLDFVLNSQDLPYVCRETHGLYGIYTDALFKFKRRIGNKPYFYKISGIEAIDVDTEDDLKIVEALCIQE